MFENLNLKEIYDNINNWNAHAYRFFKDDICFERMHIIDFDLKSDTVLIMDTFENEKITINKLFNKVITISENDGEYFLISKEQFFSQQYEIHKLNMDIEKINKLKLLIAI